MWDCFCVTKYTLVWRKVYIVKNTLIISTELYCTDPEIVCAYELLHERTSEIFVLLPFLGSADMFIISSTKWTGPCNRNAQLLTKCTWLFNTHSIEEAFSHYSHILQSAARVITREFWSSSFCFHTLENNGKNINVSSALQECLEYNTQKTRHNQWNIYVLQISYSLCIFDLR